MAWLINCDYLVVLDEADDRQVSIVHQVVIALTVLDDVC